MLSGSLHSSTLCELEAEEHRREEREGERQSQGERYGWESLIEPLFQVRIYSTDPGLAHTPARTWIRQKHSHAQPSITE